MSIERQSWRVPLPDPGRHAGYRHMSAEDRKVWGSFLSLVDSRGWTITYDVPLGGLCDLPEDEEGPYAGMWRSLRCKRIDAVARMDGRIILFEVKPVLNLTALGQLLGYRSLWMSAGLSVEPPELAAVVYFSDPELGPVFEGFGVEVVEVRRGLANQALGSLFGQAPY